MILSYKNISVFVVRFTVTIIALIIFFTLCFPLFAQEKEGEVQFLLPPDIVSTYFPFGENYLIPRDPGIDRLVERARFYEEKGNNRYAAQYYYRAYRKVEGSSTAPYLRFKQCILLENLELSIKGLQEIVQKYPSFPLLDAVRYELARKFYLGGETDSALAVLNDILENEKQNIPVFTPFVYTFCGIISKQDKKYDQALNYLQTSISFISQLEITDDNFLKEIVLKNYLEQAECLIELKEYQKAHSILIRIYGTSGSPEYKQESLYLIYRCSNLQSNLPLALSALKYLTTEYPDSLYGIMAFKELESIKEQKEVLPDIVGIYDPSILKGTYIPGEQIESSSIPVEKNGFSVQVGSFSEVKNAENFVSLLKEKGFSAYIVQASVEGKSLYRIRVGRFDSRSEAQSKLNILKSAGFNGFVIEE